jgi:DNA-binding PadR family transcriptional regulator
LRHQHTLHQHHQHRHPQGRGRDDNSPCGMSDHDSGHRGRGRHRFGHHRGGDHAGRGRGRRGVFDAGELRLVLLRLIADKPSHGYDLIQAIEGLSGGAYAPSPGVVYPALSMLEDMGHIAAVEAEGSRKAFAVTPDGEAALAENAEKVDALLARLAGFAAEQDRTDAAPVRRAMDNLRTALMTRLRDESADRETVHSAAEILDEAARKIERL